MMIMFARSSYFYALLLLSLFSSSLFAVRPVAFKSKIVEYSQALSVSLVGVAKEREKAELQQFEPTDLSVQSRVDLFFRDICETSRVSHLSRWSNHYSFFSSGPSPPSIS